ncbi:MAG TPA: family 16 glycosylhydrolase [Bacteroidales bacterium]|nr:family 16 glycosylhydrolase [Bacteroidales bacterium]HPT21642.1 family 16 glycosylhydrolase [Bacteroidales bacterium]
MASLKLLLGMIPSTSKIEQAEKALISEFEKLQACAKSDQLARYNELNKLVNSSDFNQKKKEIESLQYKNSEEYSKEKEFLSVQKAKDIVLYFQTTSDSYLKKFREMEGSDKIREFESLGKFIKSPEFLAKQKMKPITFKDTEEYRKYVEYKGMKSDPEIKAFLKSGSKDETKKSKTIQKYEELDAFIKSSAFLAKQNMKPITFKDSDEYKKLLDYNRLRESSEIKEFYKFKESKEYANFVKTDGSARLKKFYELKEYVASQEFKEKKAYLLDKKRFEKTDMFKQLEEYNKLKKNEDIIWYFKTKDSNKFDILKNREMTFCEEFEGEKLDSNKWIPNYYWGDKLLKDNYSVESDLQAYTEKENFEFRNSVLRINTRPQKITGKVWSANKGFSTKEFNYTSGLISSGKSFRQKYGVFTAKIKLGDPNAKSAFWILADKITPHIDICRTANGKVLCDFFPKNGNRIKASIGSRYANDFFIYTLEWSSDKLVWKINNTEIFRQTSDIPQEPMYISLAGGLDKPINGTTAMEIDWVRVYQPKK